MYERPGPIEAALRKLEALLPDRTGLDGAPQMLAQFGVPAECILQTAAERESGIIVLGARPLDRNSVKRAAHLGAAVAHRVIVGANCPVLTVRA